jgi:hypothetical protein
MSTSAYFMGGEVYSGMSQLDAYLNGDAFAGYQPMAGLNSSRPAPNRDYIPSELRGTITSDFEAEVREGLFQGFGDMLSFDYQNVSSREARRFASDMERAERQMLKTDEFRKGFEQEVLQGEEKIAALAAALQADGEETTKVSTMGEYTSLAKSQMAETQKYLSELDKFKAGQLTSVTDSFIDPMTGKSVKTDTEFTDMYTGSTEADLRKNFKDQFTLSSNIRTAVTTALANEDTEMLAAMGLDEETAANSIRAQAIRGSVGDEGFKRMQETYDALGFNSDLFNVEKLLSTQETFSAVGEAGLAAFEAKYGSASDLRMEQLNARKSELDDAMSRYEQQRLMHQSRYDNDRNRNDPNYEASLAGLNKSRATVDSLYNSFRQGERESLLAMLPDDVTEGINMTYYQVDVDKGFMGSGLGGGVTVKEKDYTYDILSSLDYISNEELYTTLENAYAERGMAAEKANKSMFRDEFLRRQELAKKQASAELKQNEINKTRTARIAEEKKQVRVLAEKQRQEYNQVKSSQGPTLKGNTEAGISFSDPRPM